MVRRPISVLIVDDHEPFRRAARAVIEATGRFRVVGEADSGEAALTALPGRGVDVVLMDVSMAGMGGVEATRRIRAAHPRVAVVLTSTSEVLSLRVHARSCGADGYLEKSRLSVGTLDELWRTLITPKRYGAP